VDMCCSQATIEEGNPPSGLKNVMVVAIHLSNHKTWH
jgi:hypothetical protein